MSQAHVGRGRRARRPCKPQCHGWSELVVARDAFSVEHHHAGNTSSDNATPSQPKRRGLVSLWWVCSSCARAPPSLKKDKGDGTEVSSRPGG